jgi:hypothetical protein
MSDPEHTTVSGLSQDEVRTVLLALAHLFNFLPEWDCELRHIADKLHPSCGAKHTKTSKTFKAPTVLWLACERRLH